MDFVFLGTGAGLPAKLRNVTSIVLQLLEERGTIWLFDCGEATQHQILHTTVKTRRIEKIFITHLHGDHIYGLPGLLGSRSFQGGAEPVTIYGPQGIATFVKTALEVSQTHLKYPLEFSEVSEGVVFEDQQFLVEARLLEHALPSYGYRITEKDKPGELKVTLLREAGIKPGPIYKLLKDGETVQLEDGRIINGVDFTGDPIKGKIVTVLGDTRPCQNAIELSLESDYVIHEATFKAGQEEMAYAYFHSTTVQAAETAIKARAKHLILTHISSRFTENDEAGLLEEAEVLFPNVVLAKDLMQIKIR